jgi:hypothetical protein
MHSTEKLGFFPLTSAHFFSETISDTAMEIISSRHLLPLFL